MEVVYKLRDLLEERLQSESYVTDGEYADYVPAIGDEIILLTYDLVRDNDDFDLAIYTSDDGDTVSYTHSLFLAEAIRRDDAEFFAKILDEPEGYGYTNYNFDAVRETRNCQLFLTYLRRAEDCEYSNLLLCSTTDRRNCKTYTCSSVSTTSSKRSPSSSYSRS